MNLYTKFEVSILTVVEISSTKNLERKKTEQIQGRTNRRMSFFNLTIQLVVVNLYTKFKVSILNGYGDNFDEKSGEKEKGTNTRKNKWEKAHFQSHDTTCHCEAVYKI